MGPVRITTVGAGRPGWARMWVLAALGAAFAVGCLRAPEPGSPPASSQETTGRAAAPRRDLEQDERRGGHTLARHVGRSDADLRRRLDTESISAASTFDDRDTAEQVVYETLRRSRDRVSAWASRRGSRPNLALTYRGAPERPVGRTLRRGARASEPAADAVVVLRWDVRRGDYYVLTSYPEGRR